MKNQKCTVLVPTYNEEKNIKNCLENILKQTYREIEVLIVDDGSDDKTAEIVSGFVKAHTNIKYLHQHNSGAAMARRNGLMHCETEYITFLDADDLLSLDAISLAMKEFDQNIGMVLYKLAVSKNPQNSDFYYPGYFTQNTEFSGKAAFENCLYEWKAHGLGIFRKEVFLKSYLDYDGYNPNNLNYINNDEVITKFNFINAINIRVCDGIYFYNQNLDSTTKKVNSNFYKILNNTNIIIDFCKKNNLSCNEGKLLFCDVKLVRAKLREREKQLKNVNVWKKVLREKLKKIMLTKERALNLKIRWKCLQYYLKLYF